jgi:RNA-directed DNA polymerase
LTAGRRLHRTRTPDTVGSAARQPTALRGIADTAKADKPHRVRDRSRGLHVERLLECWGDRHQDAASGVDGVTWPASAANLPANVEAGVERLQQKRYRAQLRRRRDLPQGNGQERP